MADTGVVAGGAVTGKAARRSGGKLPPHVMVYFVMALALFADDDYGEVAARLVESPRGWWAGELAWDPTPGAITQARQRLGPEPMAEVFGQVAVPVADLDTAGAFLGRWRLMSVDEMEWDVPDTARNRAVFGCSGDDQAAYPKIRVVTVSECGSHEPVLAAMGPAAAKGSGEQSLARSLYPDLDQDWLLIADRNFYNWRDWCTAAGTGAALLWRARPGLLLPVLELLPDGSYRSVLISPKITGKNREALIAAARRGEDLDGGQARHIRVIEYEVPDREGNGKGEMIALITTITDPRQGPAAVLAQAYRQRWEHQGASAQLKTCLRGPAKVLRSRSPDLVEQEIWGYLLTHYAISALTCSAATAVGDPDRIKFRRTVGRRGELASRQAAEHPGSIGLASDIADPESVHQGIAQATAELGAIDILVLNSGGPPLGDAAWLTPHEMAVRLGTCGRSANSVIVSMELCCSRKSGSSRLSCRRCAVEGGGASLPSGRAV